MQKRYAAVLLAAALLTGCGSPAEPMVEALPPGSHTEAVTTRPVHTATTGSTTLTTVPVFPLTGFKTIPQTTETTAAETTGETSLQERVVIAPESVPAGLTEFLESFSFYTADYNSKDINSARDFFMMLMNGYLCDLSAYAGAAGEPRKGEDPRYRWDKSVRTKSIGWPQEMIDWVLTYIYHWSAADIAALVQTGDADGSRLPNTAASFYLEKGWYYTLSYEMENEYKVTVDEVRSDGIYYYVTYHAEQISGEESWDAGAFQAILQYINRDGTAKTVQNLTTVPTNAFPEATTTAPAATTAATTTTASVTTAGTTVTGTGVTALPAAASGDGCWSLLRKSDKPIF